MGVESFFNSLNLSGCLLDGIEEIINKCGFVINEAYCCFSDKAGKFICIK